MSDRKSMTDSSTGNIHANILCPKDLAFTIQHKVCVPKVRAEGLPSPIYFRKLSILLKVQGYIEIHIALIVVDYEKKVS